MPLSYSKILLVTFLGAIPILVWRVIYAKEKKRLGQSLDGLSLGWVFGGGVFSAAIAMMLEVWFLEKEIGSLFLVNLMKIWWLEEIPQVLPSATMILFLAFFEEISKLAVVLFCFLKNRASGIVLGMTVGLAFGVVENGAYFASFFKEENQSLAWGSFLVVAFLRFLFSTSAHMVYSGMAGFFIEKAFQKKHLLSRVIFWSAAIFSSSLIHFLFNFYLTAEKIGIIFSILFLGMGSLFFLLEKTRFQSS